MARLVSVGLPYEKRMEIALTCIYGIGRTQAEEALESAGVSPDTRIKDSTGNGLIKLCDFIQVNYKVEGGLCREVVADIRRKIEINCHQGRRHRAGLPVHGQRTKTSTCTRKGPKCTVTGKKKAK